MINKDETIAILLVDDHELILEGYKNVLTKVNIPGASLTFDTAVNCDTAWKMLNTNSYQVLFLDINFPVDKNSRFLSGEDLGIAAREAFPEIKMVLLTVLEDAFRLQNLLVHINPAGFLLKGETGSNDLQQCLEKIMTSPPYYSSKITRLLRSRMGREGLVDELDRKILYQLSLGTKTKDLPQYIPLSLRAIEDRKRKLKDLFEVEGRGNKALLEKARESGYI